MNVSMVMIYGNENDLHYITYREYVTIANTDDMVWVLEYRLNIKDNALTAEGLVRCIYHRIKC